jgi:hypothetical protein
MGCGLLLSASRGYSGVAACSSWSIGVDTSFAAFGTVSGIFGEASGQTFLATDTLVRSIAVWRDPYPNDSPMKLWITGVDSTTGKPITGQVILDGPVLVVLDGDRVHPTRIRYDFDPPFALPGPGRYAFFVQQLCIGYFELLYADSDQYPGGVLWRTGRSQFGGCYLRGNPFGFVDSDMVFEIEFCDTSATPVRRMPWGRLKLIYR